MWIQVSENATSHQLAKRRGLSLEIFRFPVLTLRRSGCSDRVFTGAGISPCVELAGARALDAFHFAGAAGDLILVPGRGLVRQDRLIVVENLIAVLKRFHIDAPGLNLLCGNVLVLGIHAVFRRDAIDIARSGALCRRERESMAVCVAGRNALRNVGVVALAGERVFGLSSGGGCKSKSKYGTRVENLEFHVFLLRFEVSQGATTVRRIRHTNNRSRSSSIIASYR
jgi:hypothetical protein